MGLREDRPQLRGDSRPADAQLVRRLAESGATSEAGSQSRLGGVSRKKFAMAPIGCVNCRNESFQNQTGYKDWRYRSQLSDGKFDVVLAQCASRGNISCGQAVRDLFEQVRPNLVILSGIAGGCEGRDDVCLGDVVVGDYVQYY
jgi:nucleoside phosphorylase